MNKPNIVFMISHDTGRYLSCYGKQAATPELDALAGKGVRFDQYFCTAPQCSPSRGSILTGLYPVNHGMMGLAHLGFSMKADVTTLPMALRQEGYETALIGMSHETIDEPDSRLTSSGHKLGYDYVEKVPGDRAPAVADRAIAYLQEKAAAEDGRPFYVSVGFFETHRDFDEYAPVADPTDSIEPPAYLPNTAEVREDYALLHGSVKTLDKAIGRIVKAIEETGLQDNTLVIFSTDHGTAFPRAKGTLMEAGLETALIMYAPGRLEGGRVISDLLCNVDLMPTLLEFAGAKPPERLDGKSFLPLLEGEKTAVRDHFFCEMTWHDQYHPMRGIRTDRFKYIRNFEEGPSVYLPLDIHRSLSGQSVRDAYYVPNVPEELYDLQSDALEQHNLAGDPAYQDVLKELRGRVEAWMQGTGDPLLSGKIAGVAAPDWQEQIDNGTAYQVRKQLK